MHQTCSLRSAFKGAHPETRHPACPRKLLLSGQDFRSPSPKAAPGVPLSQTNPRPDLRPARPWEVPAAAPAGAGCAGVPLRPRRPHGRRRSPQATGTRASPCHRCPSWRTWTSAAPATRAAPPPFPPPPGAHGISGAASCPGLSDRIQALASGAGPCRHTTCTALSTCHVPLTKCQLSPCRRQTTAGGALAPAAHRS